jgi:hypothetical protein
MSLTQLDDNEAFEVVGLGCVDIKGQHVRIKDCPTHYTYATKISFDEFMQTLHTKSSIEITSLHDIFPSNESFPNIKDIVVKQPTFTITHPVNSCKCSCDTLVVNQNVKHLELPHHHLNAYGDEPKVTFAENVKIETIIVNMNIKSFVEAVRQYIIKHPETRGKGLFEKHSGVKAQYIDELNIAPDIAQQIRSYLPIDVSIRNNMNSKNKTLQHKREYRQHKFVQEQMLHEQMLQQQKQHKPVHEKMQQQLQQKQQMQRLNELMGKVTISEDDDPTSNDEGKRAWRKKWRAVHGNKMEGFFEFNKADARSGRYGGQRTNHRRKKSQRCQKTRRIKRRR